MPRLNLKPLENYSFWKDIEVRTSDLNYGGHLGHDRVLALAHEARVAFLAEHGWTELDCAGRSLIMGDAAAVYLKEAFAGETLRIEVAVAEPTACGFRMFYRLTRKGDGQVIALVETGLVCFDYQHRKIACLPEPLRRVCHET